MNGDGCLAGTFTARRGELEASVDLDVAPGRTLALFGPNGAGKSTVLAAIAGLVPLASGRLRLGDRVLADAGIGRALAPEDRRIGVVFQDYLLFPHLTVRDNVAFAARMAGASRRASREAAEAWLARVGASGLAARHPLALSGGQQQRVAVARALAAEPDALLLDEPLSALDVEVRADLRRELAAHVRGFGGPTLLVTHSLADAELADEAVVLEAGRVTQRGTLDELRRAPATAYVERLVHAAA
ncbi:sulfate/molybdate ABC transporter ATP-binding protein [Agromyces sp. SYSU T00194]|uniref:sulfate/molybdate ABC transporter ATP-binding protein n=1 Tax=Agromyces chitinivorans TaxID=3158560 RepID=UPI003396893F